MTDLLLDVEPVTPRWVILKDKYSIHTEYSDVKGDDCWEAYTNEPEREFFGSTEKEAVVGLIQKFRLDGWQDVSL